MAAKRVRIVYYILTGLVTAHALWGFILGRSELINQLPHACFVPNDLQRDGIIVRKNLSRMVIRRSLGSLFAKMLVSCYHIDGDIRCVFIHVMLDWFNVNETPRCAAPSPDD